jgi:hypothetical protein
MNFLIVPASPDDAGEILALQKKAYQSEAKLNDDWTLPPLTQTLPEIISEFKTKVFLKAVCTSETAAAHPRAASCGASKAPPHENGTR